MAFRTALVALTAVLFGLLGILLLSRSVVGEQVHIPAFLTLPRQDQNISNTYGTIPTPTPNTTTTTTTTINTTTPNATTTTATIMSGGPTNGGYRTVAYYVNWAIYGRKHRPQDLPAEKLTHVLYAFANVRPESGEVYLSDTWADTDIHWEGDSWNDVGTNLYGCMKQLNLLKRRNRNLKVLLSIGGWTYSPNFRVPASTAEGRATFARTAVTLLADLGLDGLDIDWEYPKDAREAADLVSLLQACRDALDAHAATLPERPHFELTIACSAGPYNYERMDLPAMDRLLDFWNLMAYDYAGSWDPLAAHQANLFPVASAPARTPFSTARAISGYVARGVPPHKIVVGMPLYGRAFENTDGPGTPYNGIGEGTWEQGVHDYKVLPLPGSIEQEDAEAGASYSYDPVKRKMVTYDTVPIVRRKAEFIKERRLGGAMWWESSCDKEGAGSLIGNVVDVLGGTSALKWKENCLSYPTSKYENVKNGFPNN